MQTLYVMQIYNLYYVKMYRQRFNPRHIHQMVKYANVETLQCKEVDN